MASARPAQREAVARLVPWLADDLASLRDWNQTSFLSVESGRVRRWYRPGLLLIGDAAHVMSPVGGVGVTCAIQDAVTAARLLGPSLLGDVDVDAQAQVQHGGEWAVCLTQACQRLMPRRIGHGPAGVLIQSDLACPSGDNEGLCFNGYGVGCLRAGKIRWQTLRDARPG